MKFVTAASAALVAMATLESVSAHSYLVKPVGRIQSVRTDTDNSIGCPTNNKGKVTSFEAGETIDVAYWRNNHLGGFIRWAILPANEQLSAANFDKNVFYYTCRESGNSCLPKGQNNRYSGDSSGDNTISCGDKIKLPDYLPAGDYVLQWMWFGVGSSYGNLGWAEPQFKSCADIKLTSSGTKSKPACPTFVGGDRVTKLENKGNDVCFYFHSTEIAKTWYKGDNNKAKEDYKFGRPSDYEKCSGSAAGEGDNGGAGNSTAPSTAPAPATTRPSPVPQPNPQPAPKPEPTPAPAPKPTDAPKPAPAPKPTGKCGVRRN